MDQPLVFVAIATLLAAAIIAMTVRALFLRSRRRRLSATLDDVADAGDLFELGSAIVGLLLRATR
ncbi:hypothetical protein [Antrihabitans sp. YC2-6]|uniref:hypothetical protein n=1 Tax=Antrihabitans sp. YC2-6 TaxID=2799498 RepID=UPI0018F48C3E|nr:hypothetical protein [Antrihabitans sp. YC2-6]MBJ8345102.1 hypothetical protein [Antrihabitans sp. YC2-6]